MQLRRFAMRTSTVLLLLAALTHTACDAGAGASHDGGPDDPGNDAGAIDAAPGNATLAALTASAGVLDPPFEPEVAEYHLDLLLAEDTVRLTPTAASAAGVTITIDGATVASGAASALAPLPGSRDVDVIVTAGDGSAATYRIHLHRGVDALSGLAPSAGALRPAFTPATTGYALPLAIDQPSATVTPALLIPSRATVTVGGAAVASGTPSAPIALAPGPNPIAIVVTPATRAARTYAIDAGRGADALAAIALSYDGGVLTNPLMPGFDPATTSYAIDVGIAIEHISIAATLMVPGTSLTIAGATAQSSTPAAPVRLNLGLTQIPIVIDAGGGLQRSYVLTVTRGAAVAQRAYVKASNPDVLDSFGAVALWGDTMVVGAPGESSAAIGVNGVQSDDSLWNAGAVYVFIRTGDSWTQQAYLKASNTSSGDNFGSELALWGDTLVVGSPYEDSAATGIGGNQNDNSAGVAGAVYVFTRTGSTWSQQAYLKASNTAEGDLFGIGVALWGDTLAVSASGEDSGAIGVDGNQNDDSAPEAGAVYVFTRSGATWSQQAYIKASNTDAGDDFGRAIALAGDTLVVTADREDSAATEVGGDQTDDTATDRGAAYVFTRTGTTWSQQAYLKAAFGLASNRLGVSVATWHDTVAIGGLHDPGESGVVYVYTRTGTSWARTDSLWPSPGGTGNRFGSSVAVWGDTVAVGAGGEDSESGAVYLFRPVNGLLRIAHFGASNRGAGDWFGGVALWGDTLAVGAGGEDSAAAGIGGDQASNAATDSGAVYLFR